MCSLPAPILALSDSRRVDINAALTAFQSQLSLTIPPGENVLRKARKNAESSLELAALVEEEGLMDYMSMVCRIVAISHARIGEWGVASVWANRGFEELVRVDRGGKDTLEMFDLTGKFVGMWKEQVLNVTGRSVGR